MIEIKAVIFTVTATSLLEQAGNDIQDEISSGQYPK